MLSAGRPVRGSVIAAIDRQVSLAYLFSVAESSATAGVAATAAPPNNRAIVASSAAILVGFMAGIPCSLRLFDTGHRDALHEITLQGEEEGDHRRDGHDRAGEQHPYVRAVWPWSTAPPQPAA